VQSRVRAELTDESIERRRRRGRNTCMHVSSQSCPKRMTTARSSSARMDWSTAHPECRCGKRYDMVGAEVARGRKLGRRKPRGKSKRRRKRSGSVGMKP